MHPTTTSISPTAFLVGLTVIFTSCPSAVKNFISTHVTLSRSEGSLSPAFEKLPSTQHDSAVLLSRHRSSRM